jgi:cytochrome c-type protein NapB
MAFPGGATAPRMSHAPLTSCTQCHVVQTAALFELDEQSEARAAKRLHSPSRAHTRAFLPGAPPVIPHSTFMRERCDACHGRGAANAIKSDHTERIHCRQCHATTRTPERYDTLAEAISR